MYVHSSEAPIPLDRSQSPTAGYGSPFRALGVGRRNVVWGWSIISLGALSGSILMAWSFAGPFPAPPGFKEYGDLARRMARLAHIALFMLPIINILIGKDLESVALSRKWKQICSWSGIVAMIGIPTGLLLAATFHVHFKYLSLIPVNALILCLCLMGYGVTQRERLAGRTAR